MRHVQAGWHAHFFFQCQLGLGGAALLTRRDERLQIRVVLCRMRSQWVLWRHGTERDTHDGVWARGEHEHATIVDQLPTAIGDLMREREANPFAFTDPVLLHQTDALRPTSQAVFNVGQQLGRVIGDR